MNDITSISVQYRHMNGWHVFTSEDIDGLYVASQNAQLAYDDVAPSIQKLLELNEDIYCEVYPERSFSDFKEWKK